MSKETQIPRDVTQWIATLPNRSGWGSWDNVGQSVYEGVQSWSEKGDEQNAIGVWGNVVEPRGVIDGGEEPFVQWCVYMGDCRTPERGDFESAEAAMRWAEITFPEMFSHD